MRLLRTQARYNTRSFDYVGGLYAYRSPGLFFVAKDAVARLYDKSKKPVIMGIVGSTLPQRQLPQVLWGVAALGWNVHGGSAAIPAAPPSCGQGAGTR